MERFQNRRRFMQLATAGAAASIAGCGDLQPSADDDVDPSTETDPAELDVSDTALTAVVQPDQEELMAIHEEVSQEVEAGDLDEMEAQQELQARQLDLVQELAESFEADAEDADGYSIEESMSEQGAYLLDGDAEAIVAELNDGSLSALLPAQEFVIAFERAQAQATQGALEGELEGEVAEESDDE
ncbi:hypothetical protein [Natronobeatus ordinarius]|uniref:hypothetical protein n=1 Tax=Natronobeatus ordinarius TaxID=2963433 RepID=UPI0020CBBA18|nr:hypothetical protein [Natronobeatus ordinarius]